MLYLPVIRLRFQVRAVWRQSLVRKWKLRGTIRWSLFQEGTLEYTNRRVLYILDQIYSIFDGEHKLVY